MKINSLCCLVVALVLVIGGAAMAADYVDIGNPTSEAAHSANGWGPSEPGTSGGNFGGIANWPGVCAVAWEVDNVYDNRRAEVNMLFSGASEQVTFQHLDGPANDSFQVWVENVMIWSYTDSGDPGEFWHVDGFKYTPSPADMGPPSNGLLTVAFVATGDKWASFDTFGQVAIAGVWVEGGPVPVDKSTWGSVKSLYR
jgi:hypothetical protein